MSRAARLGFGITNLIVGLLGGLGVFVGLPTRWWVVDTGGAVVTALMLLSGVLLLANHRRAASITRLASAVSLAVGLALFGALVLSASWLWGTYGAVGRGGAVLFLLICALVLPYLVVLPAVELVWVGPRKR